MRVETAAGRWTVRRRWAPEALRRQGVWSRFRGRVRGTARRALDVADVGDAAGCLDDGLAGVVVVVGIVVAVLFVVLVGLPLLLALGELALLLLLTIGGVVARVLFRRPWAVEAVSPEGRRYEWPIVGWRASGAVRAAVAEDLRRGGAPPSLTELRQRHLTD